MRPILYVLTFLSLIALGFWAYRENYTTQASLREVRSLQREIAGLREALSVQKAEWAYLNRPQRLRDLVDLNFEQLLLMPMEPSQFGSPSQVVFPAPTIPAIEIPEGVIDGVYSASSDRSEEGL